MEANTKFSFDTETLGAIAAFVSRARGAGEAEALARDSSEFLGRAAGGAAVAVFLDHGTPALFVGGGNALIGEKLLTELKKAAKGVWGSRLILPGPGADGREFAVHPLENGAKGMGFMAVEAGAWDELSGLLEGVSPLISAEAARLAECVREKRRISHLTTYMNVSSVVAQPLGLHDLMENVLYCLLDVFGAEAASVMLADDTREHFEFYQVEGEAKPALDGLKIPIMGGIAGDVYRTGKNEIVNDVQNDPRFFKNVDLRTSFVTRSMLVTPLTAGGEKVGVLEVINKIEGGSFSEDEGTLLASIAEEIAFAIRNARIFEYVVGSYCKQRQGLNTCKGCKRPLGAWTPCVKYSEE